MALLFVGSTKAVPVFALAAFDDELPAAVAVPNPWLPGLCWFSDLVACVWF